MGCAEKKGEKIYFLSEFWGKFYWFVFIYLTRWSAYTFKKKKQQQQLSARVIESIQSAPMDGMLADLDRFVWWWAHHFCISIAVLTAGGELVRHLITKPPAMQRPSITAAAAGHKKRFINFLAKKKGFLFFEEITICNREKEMQNHYSYVTSGMSYLHKCRRCRSRLVYQHVMGQKLGDNWSRTWGLYLIGYWNNKTDDLCSAFWLRHSFVPQQQQHSRIMCLSHIYSVLYYLSISIIWL